MARIRTVKPSLLRHRELYLAEKKHKLPLRISYVGLFTCADRDGKFKWEPEELKLDCLPYDPIDFEKVLDALSQNGFIIKYEVGQRQFGIIPSFGLHQKIRPDEAKSTIPDPPTDTKPSEPVTNPYRGKEGNIEGNMEGKGGASPPPPKIDLVYPFESENFLLRWQNWKDYRKNELSKKYKTIDSEQAALKHLARVSNGSEEIALLIIEQSMASGWQGLFELKSKNNGQQANSSSKQATNTGYFDRKYGAGAGKSN